MAAERPVNPVLHRLWRVGGSVVAVGVLGMGTVQSVSRLAHEEETIVRELDGAGLRLVDVRNGAGSVHIVGTESDTVTITARVSEGLRSTGHSERVVGDRLVLSASCPIFASDFCTVTYSVEVPEDVAVRLSSDGRVSVRDTTGGVEASADNGRVEVERVAGDLDLSSANGRVVATDLRSGDVRADSDNGRVELAFLGPPSHVTATSDNGSVEVVLPDTRHDYVVDVSSDNGTASSPEIRTDPDSDRTVTASSDNGDVTVRYPSG